MNGGNLADYKYFFSQNDVLKSLKMIYCCCYDASNKYILYEELFQYEHIVYEFINETNNRKLREKKIISFYKYLLQRKSENPKD